LKKLTFSPIAWEDYLYWQQHEKRVLKRINTLIKGIQRTPNSGIGKPEALKFDLKGFWSRRIDREHRLVYRITDVSIEIVSCRFHYDK
jgi:toxin YoeB